MFNLAMQYSPNGQILEKELMADFDIAGIQYTKQYHNAYNYLAGLNAPQEVVDQFTGATTSLKWDANGNLIHEANSETRLERNLCWDEENRLTAVRDNDFMSAYLYDHTGERTWKLAGKMQTVTINGQYAVHQVEMDRKTLYTNPYLIVTEAEYTKHYYIEGQRVASKLGGGWANALVDPLQDHLPVDQQGLNQLLVERFEILEGCSGQQADFVYLQDRFESILDQLTANDPENVQYFYHSDHLGSSSFITDASGTVDQHLQYLPFGEPWIDQRTTTGIRFTFSGKEKDEETGYSYFGSRYYNADISIWLSVDPLSDQYPSHSGYNYVMNNPVMLIDPNGMWVEGAGLLNNLFKSEQRNEAEMKAKQLSAEGALDVGVDRNGNEWHVSYREENRNEACSTEESDFTYTNLSFRPKDSSRRLGSLGIGVNFELAIPGSLTLDGKPWGFGRAIDLMADANNNIDLFRTDKIVDSQYKNSFALSLNVQFSFTLGSGGNLSPLNMDLIGEGSEWGANSGPFGYGYGQNLNRTYSIHTFPIGIRLSGRYLKGGITFEKSAWITKTKSLSRK
jgi:RHS repeat-associated protein